MRCNVTRNFLKSLGVADEAIERIIQSHIETVDGLKKELAGWKAQAEGVEALTQERDALQARLGGVALVTDADPDETEIERAAAKAKEASTIVLGTYQGHVRRGQLSLMRALAALGRPMVCAALRDPADLAGLPEGVCGLAVYEYSADSLALVARVLRGEVIPRRKAKV